MPNLFINTFCNPVSFPIGNINYFVDIPFCFDETSDKIDEDKENIDTLSSLVVDDTSGTDIKTGSKLNILNREITTSIEDNFSEKEIEQDINMNADIVLHFARTPELDGITYSNNNKMYHCLYSAHQVGNLEIRQTSVINKEKREEVVNKITAHVTDNLKEMGADSSDIDATLDSINKIQSILVNNVNTTTTEFINQQSVTSTNLTYIDQYGVCNKDGTPKVLTQKSNLTTISMNIIESTINTIMNNEDVVKTVNNIKIYRVDNTSTFFAILLDLLCLFIILKILKIV